MKNNIKKLKTFNIHGHASEIGTEEYNLNLSKERALSVMNYLLSKGVDKNKLRIDYKNNKRSKKIMFNESIRNKQIFV